MNSGKQPLGYTIVEVLIVLAISGLMLSLAATFISGKQAKTSFQAGTNEMASQITDVISEVNDGHYSDRRFGCELPTGGNTIRFTGGVQQGTNPACVFLGKFLHFSKSGVMSDYEVFSLAGARLGTNGKPATNLTDVLPTPIVNNAINLNLTEQRTVPQRLDIIDVKVDGHAVYGFGFVQGLGSTSGTGQTDYNSGAQSARLVYAPGLTSAGADEGTAAGQIRTLSYASRAAVMCVSDGARWATITVGLNNNQLGVRLQVVATEEICKGATP